MNMNAEDAGQEMNGKLAKRRSRRFLERIRSDESGDTLAFLFIWPIFFITAFLFLLHVFLINNSRAELEVAASKGLRAAWDLAVELGGEEYALNISSADATEKAALEANFKLIENRARCAAMASIGSQANFDEIENSGTPSESCVKWASDHLLINPADSGWSNVLYADALVNTDKETGVLRMVVSGTTVGPLASWWPAVIGGVSAEVCAPLPVMGGISSFSTGVAACS